jgi:hypothetical protein
MKPSEIVAIDAQTNGYGRTSQELTEQIMSMKDRGWRTVQDEDTLFVFQSKDNKGTVEFNMMVGNEQTASKSCQKFFKMLKKAGAKQLVCDYLNPAFTQIFKRLGSNYNPSFGKTENELTMKVRL